MNKTVTEENISYVVQKRKKIKEKEEQEEVEEKEEKHEVAITFI